MTMILVKQGTLKICTAELYAKIDVPQYMCNKLHSDLKNSTTVNMFKKKV